MNVLKFGGTSVGSAESIAAVCEIVKARVDSSPFIVVSAVKGTTDQLVAIACESDPSQNQTRIAEIEANHRSIISKLGLESTLLDAFFSQLSDSIAHFENSAEYRDRIIGFGERMSCRLVAACLKKHGVDAQAFEAPDLGYITDDNFAAAELLETSYANIKEAVTQLTIVPVVTGFVGKTEDGRYTTNGRGGSDLTASQFGVALSAEQIQIWTDVDGVMTTNPNVVSNAQTIAEMSYAETAELSYFGANVLHPKTIRPAMKSGIPVLVKNTFNPDHPGTIISDGAQRNERTVTAISYKKNNALVSICSSRMLGAHGFLAKLFGIFEKYSTGIDVIATTEVSVSMTLDDCTKLDEITAELSEYGTINVEKNRSIVSVVGSGMRGNTQVVADIFSTLAKNNIHVEMISQGASEINVSFIVKGEHTDSSIQLLHEVLINGKN